jgi:ribonuclease HI
MASKIRIFTDGGYSIPRNKGAWGVAVVEGNKLIKEERGEITNSTSNRAELLGLIKALELSFEFEEVEINCDSQYLVKGYNSWMKKWRQNDWCRSKNEEVKNVDLWKKVNELKNPKATVKWVKAHSGNKWNEYVDGLTKV